MMWNMAGNQFFKPGLRGKTKLDPVSDLSDYHGNKISVNYLKVQDENC